MQSCTPNTQLLFDASERRFPWRPAENLVSVLDALARVAAHAPILIPPIHCSAAPALVLRQAVVPGELVSRQRANLRHAQEDRAAPAPDDEDQFLFACVYHSLGCNGRDDSLGDRSYDRGRKTLHANVY